MTIEETLERLRLLCESGRVSADQILGRIPELRESEDERIRKELLALINDLVLPNEQKDRFNAYLEKQKEQKPALVPERIRPKFAVGDTICRPMWSDHTIQEIYIHCNDPVYVCVNEDGTESHIPMSEQDEWEQKEQKPDIEAKLKEEYKRGWDNALLQLPEEVDSQIWQIANNSAKTWEQGFAILMAAKKAFDKGKAEGLKEQKPVKLDDDTEVGLDRALQIVKDAKGNLCGYQSDDGIYECDHAIQTLERILKNGIEQKPAEWNANDKAFIKDCARILDENGYAASAERLLSMFPINPAEWSEEDEENFKWFDKFFRAESVIAGGRDIPQDKYSWFKSLRPKQKVEWSEEDEEAFDMCIDAIPKAWKTKSGILLTKWLKDNIHLQSKQEWNEEDEKHINSIFNDFKQNVIPDEEDQEWLKNRFKSLRPQPKVELTLLDENIIKAAVAFVEQNNHFNCWGGIDKHTVIKALCSLKPHWKPSEEQMEALMEAMARLCGSDIDAIKYAELCDLEIELKKLM